MYKISINLLVVFYFYLVSFLPYFRLGGSFVRIEHLFGVVSIGLFFFFLFAENKLLKNKSLVALLVLFVINFLTLLSCGLNGWAANWIGLYFYWRYIALAMILVFVLYDTSFDARNHFLVVAAVYCFFSMIHHFFPEFWRGVVEIYYSSPERISALQGFDVESAVLRSYGILESPTWAGLFFGISLIFSRQYYGVRRLILLTVAIMGGLLSISATFFGLFVVWLGLGFFSGGGRSKNLLFLALALLVVGSFFVSEDQWGALNYQLVRILTLNVFDTRYSVDGNIGSAFSDVSLFGYGSVIRNNIFLGDSLFLALWNDFGVFSIFFMLFLYVIFVGERYRDVDSNVLFFSVLLAGLGSASFFCPRISDILLIISFSRKSSA